MEALSPWHLALILAAVLLLFGYKKLPDAARSMGRSMRIFKGEMQGMRDDDVRARQPAAAGPSGQTPVSGEVVGLTGGPSSADADRLAQAAAEAEAHAAAMRARAEQARVGEGPR